jgi:hypothetical protein
MNPGELERFMASIRHHESSNDYTRLGPYSPGHGYVRGAYQFLDSTWNNYKNYPVASSAPPEVQDERARQLMTQYYNKYQDWGLVAIAWHGGPNKANKVFEEGLDPNQWKDVLGTKTGDYANMILNTAGLDGTNGVWNGKVMDQETEDNWVILRDQMEDYGLGELYDFAYEMIMNGSQPAAVMIQLQDEPAYKDRFKAMADRIANGYGPISPGDYIANEREYKTLLEQAGLPVEVFGSKEDIEAYIANDVAPDELEWRIGMAVTATESADPEIKKQLEELYGIGGTNSDLVAYYLDPDRAVTYIEGKQQLEAAELSAAAVGALGTSLNRNIAERLAGLDIQPREISERLKGRGSLTQSMLGSEGLSGSEFAAAEFGMDSESTAQLRKMQQVRQGMGKRRSGAMATQQGVTGLGSAS